MPILALPGFILLKLDLRCFKHSKTKTQVELHLNYPFKNMRTNWGGEYHSLTKL